MEDGEYTIHTRTKECVRRFSDLCPLEASEGQSWAEDHKARFHVWATSLGLLTPGLVSSDRDLRDNRVNIQVIAQLLSALDANLLYLVRLHLKRRGQLGDLPDDRHIVDYTRSPVSSLRPHRKDFLGEDIIDLVSSSRREVAAGLSRLTVMTRAIRLSGKPILEENGENFVDRDKYGNNLTSFYSRLARSLLDYKFPLASEAIRIRLAQSMSQRRNRLAYVRSIQKPPSEKKLQISSTQLMPNNAGPTTSLGRSQWELELELGMPNYARDSPRRGLPIGRRDSTMSVTKRAVVSRTTETHHTVSNLRSPSEVSLSTSERSLLTRNDQMHLMPLVSDQKFRLRLQTLPPTPNPVPLVPESIVNESTLNVDASQVRPSTASSPESSGVSTATTEDFSQADKFDHVKTPTLSGGDEFDCPYCLQRRPVQDGSGVRWRRHMIADLKPYVCLYDKCKESGGFSTATPTGTTEESPKLVIPTFGNFEAWISHMGQHPTAAEWICSAPAHEPISFSESHPFEEHMRNCHTGTFAASELPDLARMSMRSTSRIFDRCPLCDYFPEHQYTALLSTVVQNALHKHVASHLKDLTLISIRWLQDEVDGKPNDNASFTTRPSKSNSSFTTRVGALDHTSDQLTFQDPPSRDRFIEGHRDTELESSFLAVEPPIPDPAWFGQIKSSSEEHIPSFEEEWGFQKKPESLPVDIRIQTMKPNLQGAPLRTLRIPTFFTKSLSETGSIQTTLGGYRLPDLTDDMPSTQSNNASHDVQPENEGNMSPRVESYRERDPIGSLQQMLAVARRQEDDENPMARWDTSLFRTYKQSEPARDKSQAVERLEKILRWAN